MAHMDDRGNSAVRYILRSRLSLVVLGLIVLVTAVGIRFAWFTREADAQVPRQRTTTKNRARRASSPTQPRKTVTRSQATPRANDGKNVVAVVNGEPITRQTLGQQCLVRWGDEVIESLVNKHLITQACRDRSIRISEQDVEDEIARIAGKFSLSKDHWLKMLHSERDISAQQYRRDIIWPKLALRRLAADKLQVTKEELDRELESEYGPKVQVRMISLTSRAKAEKVWQLVKANPAEFPALAKEYSDDPNTASVRGLIPPVRRHIGEPDIESTVFALAVGEVSAIVQAANQFLIFRCEKHIPGATISPQYRQITMDQLKDRIVERNLRDAASELFKTLQANTKIVNVINDPKLQKQSPGVAAFVNNKRITMRQLTEECLARHGHDMLDTEINYRLLSQSLKRRRLTVTQAALNQEIARAAEAFGYLKKDGLPDVDAWVTEVTEQEGIGVKEYIRDAVWPSVALKQLVGNQVKVTQDDLQKGFEANYGKRVKVLAIVIGHQRMAQDVWDMARKNPTRDFFGQLAEQYSIESVSRANFGEIPPIARNGGQPQIEREAFRLKPGELSGIVAMGNKFIIMKCLGHTIPIVEHLDDVKSELYKDIHEKKLRLAMAEEYDRMRESAQIDNFLEGTSQMGKVAVQPVSTSTSVKRKRGAIIPAFGKPISIAKPVRP